MNAGKRSETTRRKTKYIHAAALKNAKHMAKLNAAIGPSAAEIGQTSNPTGNAIGFVARFIPIG
jgi:hypothetical protein